jgi:hypothetical protein
MVEDCMGFVLAPPLSCAVAVEIRGLGELNSIEGGTPHAPAALRTAAHWPGSSL